MAAAFRNKTIGPKESVGRIFTKRREALRLSLYHASQKTDIAERYLRALEEGKHDALPGLIYGKNFIRKYSVILGLSAAPLVRAFAEEYSATQAPRRVERPQKQRRSLLTPLRFRLTLGLVVFGLFGWYVTGEVSALMRAPELHVTTPASDMMTNDASIVVQGTTEADTRVTVNGRHMSVENMFFETSVPLHEGRNTILVRASRRHGKTEEIERQVIRTTTKTVVHDESTTAGS